MGAWALQNAYPNTHMCTSVRLFWREEFGLFSEAQLHVKPFPDTLTSIIPNALGGTGMRLKSSFCGFEGGTLESCIDSVFSCFKTPNM